MNIAIVSRKHKEVCGKIAEMIQMIVHSKSFKFKINETGKAPVAGNNTKGFKNRNAVKILN